MRTFDFLTLLVTDVSRNLHRITNNRVPTRVVYRAFHCRLVLDHVDRKTCALRKRAELVIDRFHLNRVERNKCRLTRTLVAHVLEHNIEYWPTWQSRMKWRREAHLYAVDGSPLLVYNDGINITTEDNRDSGFVFPLSRFAQID